MVPVHFGKFLSVILVCYGSVYGTMMRALRRLLMVPDM